MSVLAAPATTARLDAALASCPDHLRPVLTAVRDRRVGLLFVTQGAAPFTIPNKPERPAVIILGDDLEQSMGPDGFPLPSLRRAIRACCAFAVISSAPPVDVYAGIAAVAVGGRHALIVETRIEHEFQWVALIQKLAPRRPLIVSTVEGGNA